MADESTIAIGAVLDGKYEITDILGEGGMGVVYLALHKRLQRMVAVKTLRDEYAADARLIERFEREARAASAIGHPNIVQVYDAGGGTGGVPYLVMESLQGQSLGDLLRDSGNLDMRRTVDVCRQVLAGLGAAHAAGILHRDLKPDNIFVTTDADGNDLVKILDFGISKFLDTSDQELASATKAGTLIGTPRYMSPEQATGRADLDARADLWAVICVLYQCLTGKTPFSGDNYQQLLAAVLQGQFVGLKDLFPAAPAALDDLVRRGLALEREDRFPDANSLSAALAAIPLDPEERVETLEEPNLLAAFDNLADRFLEQEKQDAVDLDLTQAPTLAVGATVGPRTPDPDRFAPPGSSDEISLSLDVEPTHRSTMAPAPMASSSVAAPRKRRHSQLVTRKEKSGVGAAIGKLLLVLVVLTGSGLGYRYYKLGYIIAPVLPTPATLALDLQPASAQVFLNKELTEQRTLALEAGESYALRIAAEGRLEMTASIDAAAGAKLRSSVVLSHRVLPVSPGVVASAEPITDEKPPDRASIDAAWAKLDAFGDCGERLSAALSDSVDEDNPAAELEPLARTLTDECGLTLEIASQSEPTMAKLDAASKALRAGILDHSQAILEHQKSKGASRKVMQERDKSFRKAVRSAKSSARSWREEMSQAQARWLALEALRVHADEGDTLHSHLRNLAVACDAWTRTHLAGKDAEEQQKAMHELFAIAKDAAEKAPGTSAHSGAAAYLNALRPLIDKKPGDDLLFWHNQAVFLFNKMNLPMEVVTAQL